MGLPRPQVASCTGDAKNQGASVGQVLLAIADTIVDRSLDIAAIERLVLTAARPFPIDFLPAGSDPEALAAAEEAAMFEADAVEAAEEAPLRWEEVRTADGQVYYCRGDETTWDCPPELMKWEVFYNDVGQAYYCRGEETTWELPPELAAEMAATEAAAAARSGAEEGEAPAIDSPPSEPTTSTSEASLVSLPETRVSRASSFKAFKSPASIGGRGGRGGRGSAARGPAGKPKVAAAVIIEKPLSISPVLPTEAAVLSSTVQLVNEEAGSLAPLPESSALMTDEAPAALPDAFPLPVETKVEAPNSPSASTGTLGATLPPTHSLAEMESPRSRRASIVAREARAAAEAAEAEEKRHAAEEKKEALRLAKEAKAAAEASEAAQKKAAADKKKADLKAAKEVGSSQIEHNSSILTSVLCTSPR